MTWFLYAGLALIAYKLLMPAGGSASGATAAKKQLNTMSAEHARKLLGVERNADDTAIRKAYQQKVRQYHPDLVANAAPEIQALAEKRTKEFNAAYDFLIKNQP